MLAHQPPFYEISKRKNSCYKITKLISTFTGHMITALCSLDHPLALATLSVMEIALEEVQKAINNCMDLLK